jgi:hypothetical protein
VGLNHFTVPIVIGLPSKTNCRRSEMNGGSNFGTVRGAGPALDQSLGEQAEPLESDDRIDKLSRLLLQLRPVSSRPVPG